MALFGRLSEKLIQAYRDKLRIIALEDPLPIRSEQVELYNFKPKRFEFLATIEDENSSGLTISTTACNADLSIVCSREQIEPTVPPSVPCNANLELPPLQIRQVNLLSVEDVRALKNSEACESPVALVRKAELI